MLPPTNKSVKLHIQTHRAFLFTYVVKILLHHGHVRHVCKKQRKKIMLRWKKTITCFYYVIVTMILLVFSIEL